MYEQIRVLLHKIDPNVEHVGVEVKSVGAEFGGPRLVVSLADLLHEAEQLRCRLLSEFWLRRDQRCILASLRLAHAMASMSQSRLRKVMDAINEK